MISITKVIILSTNKQTNKQLLPYQIAIVSISSHKLSLIEWRINNLARHIVSESTGYALAREEFLHRNNLHSLLDDFEREELCKAVRFLLTCAFV